MRIFSRISLLLTTLALPIAVLAAPANVRDITAEKVGDKVQVTWTHVPGDIAQYRIFYSHASIMQNNGLYDDFESVDGSMNEHLLQNIPSSAKLFVSILAVDAMGKESPYFVEEAEVTLGTSGGTSTPGLSLEESSESELSLPALVAERELRLLSAEAMSMTGVLLRFNYPVIIPAEQAAEAIVIETASGSKLALVRYVIQGNTLMVHTQPQESAVVYRVRVQSAVTGKDDKGASVPLASDQAPMLFTSMAESAGSSSSAMTTPNRPDVVQLNLRGEPISGKYIVEANWQAPAGEQIAGFEVMQTTDNGQTYSASITLDPTVTSVRIPNVPAGSFGLLIRVQYADGVISQGVLENIALPGGNVQGSVTNTPKPGRSTDLANSGPELWLAISSMGGLAGAYYLRKKRAVRA